MRKENDLLLLSLVVPFTESPQNKERALPAIRPLGSLFRAVTAQAQRAAGQSLGISSRVRADSPAPAPGHAANTPNPRYAPASHSQTLPHSFLRTSLQVQSVLEVLLATDHRVEMLHISAGNRIVFNVAGRFGKMLSITFVLKSINHTEKKKI